MPPKCLGRSCLLFVSGKAISLLALGCLVVVSAAGCQNRRQQTFSAADCEPCQTFFQQIEYPDLQCEECSDGTELMTGPPVTISNFQELQPYELTLDQCVEMALANSKVLQKLGGVVVNSPFGATTLYDQALTESNPNQSVEAALSAFDAQFSSSVFWNHQERVFNNPFQNQFSSAVANTVNYRMDIQKTSATGATFTYRNTIDYSANQPFGFASTYDWVNLGEIRQPIGRGRGSTVNRIAGPGAIAGNYNGVLIARLRSDISLVDFETAVRDLVRDVENNYWELFFAYRDLDTKLAAREAARETWQNRKDRFEKGLGRPDDEAQSRQQYFTFEQQVQNALTGRLNGQAGLIGSERNMRRLLGLPVSDGRVLRPITEPVTTPVVFDWHDSQEQTLGRRAELRRQKWTIRQRELELCAAKQLNKWRFDLVGQYGRRGFGDNLFGSRGQTNGSAFIGLFEQDTDDWQVGFEVQGGIGRRQGYLAVRNAELNLQRERALLKEQQRQLLHDLSSAFVETDRAFAVMKTSINNRIAVQEEYEPKEKRVKLGQDQVFFLLEAQQRVATAESNVFRAVADYNQALLNYAYTTGSLLSRYNVRLTEGPWCEDAVIRSREKACRIETCNNVNQNVDNCPVSFGAYDQTQPGPSATSIPQYYVPESMPSSPSPSSDDLDGLESPERSDNELDEPEQSIDSLLNDSEPIDDAIPGPADDRLDDNLGSLTLGHSTGHSSPKQIEALSENVSATISRQLTDLPILNPQVVPIDK